MLTVFLYWIAFLLFTSVLIALAVVALGIGFFILKGLFSFALWSLMRITSKPKKH